MHEGRATAAGVRGGLRALAKPAALLVAASALGACTAGGASQSVRTSEGARSTSYGGTPPQKAARITKTILGTTSRARQCGSPVIASMGAAVAVGYYNSLVRRGTFRRDDRLMLKLADRAYRGWYPPRRQTCESAFRAIRKAFNIVIERLPGHRRPLYRLAVAMLRSDGQYQIVMARYRARRRAHLQVQRPRPRPRPRRYERWERVYKLPENAVDL